MKIRFFQKLAWEGMKKNGKLYFPYLATCICMVMTSYILQSLSYSPLLLRMRGGGIIETVLSLGKFVIAVFSLILLFYTSSFLARRRNKEFGLYHILGMGKRGIRRIVFWESVMTAVFGISGGLLSGIALSKLTELCLARILQEETDYSFTLAPEAVLVTLKLYGILFLLLLIRSLISVQRTRPLELLHSERLGEKPPRANYLIALLGSVLLAAAYYMALSIQDPIKVLLLFFVAVIMVILATYLLFTAGSVALCRILQRNPRYYYQKQHFVSVSSMTFRMKRNGAGLASICILSTMVLVMISSTGSLYFGMEDMLSKRYPRENSITVGVQDPMALTKEKTDTLRAEYESVVQTYGFTSENPTEYKYTMVVGILQEDEVILDISRTSGNYFLYADDLCIVVFLEAGDFNRIMGTDLWPSDGEAYVLAGRRSYEGESLRMGKMELKNLGEETDSSDFPIDGNILVASYPYLTVVIRDLEEIWQAVPPEDFVQNQGGWTEWWYYGYELSEASADEKNEIYLQQTQKVRGIFEEGEGYSWHGGCRSAQRRDFLDDFGGMFFLGIVLSLVFLLATVLIIYYKQISEGYEDQARFEIMQKVGMTRRDIKKSINSQVLTVFLAPLILTGIHLAFAYSFIWKILQMFNLRNLPFVIFVTLTAYAFFGIFYVIVYKLTAGAYYGIVSGGERRS